MGAGVSHPTDSDSSLPPSRALHVLRVTPGSPASQTDIEAFFDFVVGVDGGYGGEDSVWWRISCRTIPVLTQLSSQLSKSKIWRE